MQKLDYFFSPKSVAIIGASRNPVKVGHVVLRNFLDKSFKGKVYPVNPGTDQILGVKSYKSISKISGKVDLAVITIPAPFVLKALEECGKKKVPAVVIITAGFSEIGDSKSEEKIKKLAEKYKMRVLGPNCLGVFDPSKGVDTLFLPKFKLGRPGTGDIAFISQSGATLSVVLDFMGMKGYRVSKCVSYGNATDIDEADLIEYLANDKQTKVICAYFEGIREGRKFFNMAKKISTKKPIIVLKGGTTPGGHAATLSHTGSLAGEVKIYDAAFKQSRVVKANDLEQIFDFARVFSTQPKPKGNRVQIITDGGGFGVLTTDWVLKNGLKLAKMRKESIEPIRKKLPPTVVLKNPMDLIGDATTERYRLGVNAAVNDPEVDIVAVILLFQVPALTGDVVEVIAEAKGKKPIVVISGGGKYTEALKKPLEDMGIPTFSYPERAVSALNALYNHYK